MDARTQALLDRVYSARRQSVHVALAADSPAVVALTTASLAHGADAMIIRRVYDSPHDVILLSDHQNSPEILATAINVLYKLRQRGGDFPTTNVHVSVNGTHFPRHWRVAAQDFAKADIEALRHAPLHIVGALGEVRTITIPLTSVGPRQ